ncbi:MAG: diacylglycerol kinase family lipid kinase [Lachnospiraceae bacterium]|nr:diacylglycerol kinase family lipid kinase [Lachnospiraceae bacterium]MDY5742999.1 diacylglycerol kinase family lipid kinase [Lachnospiraceae bacterium]
MYHFIINPHARSKRGRQLWRGLESILRREHFSYQAHLTTAPGHAVELTRVLTAPGHPFLYIIVVGGDGTLNEVINGILDPTNLTLGCIPVGSGNDFVRGLLGSGRTAEELLTLVMQPVHTVSVNIAQVSEDNGGQSHRFIVSCGLGYDAEATEQVNRSWIKPFFNRLHLGKLAYTLSALWKLITYRPLTITVTDADGHYYQRRRSYFSTFMNLPYEGGGLMLCPAAKPDDGLLDFCCLHGGLFPPFYSGFRAYKGAHTRSRRVYLSQSTSYRIETDRPYLLHTDGEIRTLSGPLTVSLLPFAIDVIVP